MVFKYFVTFDVVGEIDCFCKSPPKDCDKKCDEYLVKLTLIERDVSDDIAKKMDKAVNKLAKSFGKVDDSLKKTIREIDRRGLK